MKPQERPFLREFNKSPFIKYPIRETVSTTAHKISLIIQIQLGGIEHPTDKDFAVVRRQFLTDKGIIFDRIQRLIRCVIDCKAYDCDAISTRHALDLATSLAAEYWENSNLQLRQIPQVGPAAIRKLVSNDINSIEELMAKDTSTIERIMSKNPPHGRKMKDMLMSFPRLDLTSEIMGRAPSNPGQNPKVSVKVALSYLNDNIPVWKGKKPSLMFMAETTDGKLVHFWRGNIFKLEKGCELKFNVELSSPNEEIKCWVACEEIVGTVRSLVLKHNLPPSAFPALAASPQANDKSLTGDEKARRDDADEFGGDDFDDDDMLAVIRSIEPAGREYDSDEFEEIDVLEDSRPQNPKKVQKQEVFVPSVQMTNGKWTCSHPCADGKVLKNGKQCRHKCCHEGLDKPRKIKKTTDNTSGSGAGSRNNDANSRVKAASSGVAQKSKVSGFSLNLYSEPNQNADNERYSQVQGKSKRREVLEFGRG
jgi:ATP-dependent DNA helicase HFM1/MER3